MSTEVTLLDHVVIIGSSPARQLFDLILGVFCIGFAGLSTVLWGAYVSGYLKVATKEENE